jgi:hypothetical protein
MTPGRISYQSWGEVIVMKNNASLLVCISILVSSLVSVSQAGSPKSLTELVEINDFAHVVRSACNGWPRQTTIASASLLQCRGTSIRTTTQRQHKGDKGNEHINNPPGNREEAAGIESG